MRSQKLPFAFGGWTPDYMDVTGGGFYSAGSVVLSLGGLFAGLRLTRLALL